MTILIRPYEGRDWKVVWAILEPVFRAGDTYAYPLDTTEEDARATWTSRPKETFVAENAGAGEIVGTYYQTWADYFANLRTDGSQA